MMALYYLNDFFRAEEPVVITVCEDIENCCGEVICSQILLNDFFWLPRILPVFFDIIGYRLDKRPYAEGVFLSRRVYNWCLGIFVSSVIIATMLTTVAVLVWMKII